MTETTKSNTPATMAAKTGASSDLVTQQGRTTIADAVVAKIAGIATREVPGVHAVGGGAARAVGALRERIPGQKSNASQGISVEVGEREAAVDVQIVVEYGVAIADLASGVRRNVISSIERMTGLQVTEVNIEVQDIYLEEDNASNDSDEEPRVQ